VNFVLQIELVTTSFDRQDNSQCFRDHLHLFDHRERRDHKGIAGSSANQRHLCAPCDLCGQEPAPYASVMVTLDITSP
ncbi:MAG: hypothetical protein WAV53_18645, partial [Anaerolineae bacterium]